MSLPLIKQLHVQLMGAIYPFAGEWRTVSLHKGEGPTRWPLPPGGIQPLMDVLERDVLVRSPLLSEDDDEVFSYASEVMNEILAVHPFREGNGRTAFIIGNLILMQNEMLPLTTYERHADEARYYAACDAGRMFKDYAPFAALLAEWEDRALVRWREHHGVASGGSTSAASLRSLTCGGSSCSGRSRPRRRVRGSRRRGSRPSVRITS